jgi:hypothetical protein
MHSGITADRDRNRPEKLRKARSGFWEHCRRRQARPQCLRQAGFATPALARRIERAGAWRIPFSDVSRPTVTLREKSAKKILRRLLKSIPFFLIRFLPLSGGAPGASFLGPAD